MKKRSQMGHFSSSETSDGRLAAPGSAIRSACGFSWLAIAVAPSLARARAIPDQVDDGPCTT